VDSGMEVESTKIQGGMKRCRKARLHVIFTSISEV
jgi:hypothetical protein